MSLENTLQTTNDLLNKLIVLMATLNTTTEAAEAAPPEEEEKTEVKDVPADVEQVDLHILTALAVLYGDLNTQQLTEKHVAAAQALTRDKATNPDTDKANALYMALTGVKKLGEQSKATTFALCNRLLAVWDDMPNLLSRRATANTMLADMHGPAASEAPETTNEPLETEPDYAALRKEAQERILNMVKSGYRAEAVDVLTQLQAKGVKDVPDDKLAELIALIDNAMLVGG